jgi:hypothetical protein
VARTSYPDDAGLVAVLASFAVAPTSYLGHGGQAWVYALPDGRALRVLHEGGSTALVEEQRALLVELSRSPMPFALPQILEVGERFGRAFVIERRLVGAPGVQLLTRLDAVDRRALIEAHLDATLRLHELALAPRPFFGELLGPDPVRGSTWLEYLALRAEFGLARSNGRVPHVDVSSLIGEFDDVAEGRFVHFDAFLDNMLFDRSSVTAVLDFGPTAAVGDPRFDVIAAVVYLSTPAHTPTSTKADADVAFEWLRRHELADLLPAVRRWLAAFWAFSDEGPRLTEWCRSVLAS